MKTSFSKDNACFLFFVDENAWRHMQFYGLNQSFPGKKAFSGNATFTHF